MLSKYTPQVNILRTLHRNIKAYRIVVREHKIKSFLSLLSCVYDVVYQLRLFYLILINISCYSQVFEYLGNVLFEVLKLDIFKIDLLSLGNFTFQCKVYHRIKNFKNSKLFRKCKRYQI